MKKKLASAARLRGRLSSTRKVQRWLSRAVLCLAAGLGACGGGGGGGGGAAPGGSPAPGTAPPLISGFTPTSAAVGQGCGKRCAAQWLAGHGVTPQRSFVLDPAKELAAQLDDLKEALA